MDAIGDAKVTESGGAARDAALKDDVASVVDGDHVESNVEAAARPGGGVFESVYAPEINYARDVVFSATIVGGTSSRGIFVAEGRTRPQDQQSIRERT